MLDLVYAPATLNDLDVVHQLEESSYHPDEAASREQLANRIKYAETTDPNLFLIARRADTGEIAGFVCTTLTTAPLVTDESMKTHEPEGKTVCLHSVCVAPSARRQGVATAMLRYWIQLLQDSNRYSRIALLSRPNLLPLYGSVGFKDLGVSEVVHGPDPWYDAVLDFRQ
ncbi:hypothetical protein VTP01DRAFT_6036 [Rhizomucor pusillus]|uniref:uncharacterized protein n=1 Tax=Rhizomucor pusillus TaxID=4840 RepID=UPI0037425C35